MSRVITQLIKKLFIKKLFIKKLDFLKCKV